MAIPDYQSIMLPLLKFVSDKKEHARQDVIDHLALFFELSEAELREFLPSGKQAIFDNRVGWAITYFKKARLIDSPQRGIFVITALLSLMSNARLVVINSPPLFSGA